MDSIVQIKGRQILDSRGNPTVEVDVTLADGSFGTAAVPSGASTGAHEAWELRDGDKSDYMGKGVTKAVDQCQRTDWPKHSPGMHATDQGRRRRSDDRTGRHAEQKELGANAILGVSLATAHAAAAFDRPTAVSYLGGASAHGCCRHR